MTPVRGTKAVYNMLSALTTGTIQLFSEGASNLHIRFVINWAMYCYFMIELGMGGRQKRLQ